MSAGGGEREERWEFEKNIGTGGFGVVKLFTNLDTGSKVVMKECRLLSISQDNIDRWRGEMEIIKKLDHPNIVRAINTPRGLHSLTLGDTPCICMEYCDGGDLRQVLRDPENCCGLEETQIRQICRDVTQGIKFLHSERIIHRDLKPENILLKRLGEAQVIYKLTDFGYAKQYDNSSVCTSLVGTVQYVAPEVLKDKQYHSNVDFWGFGVIVFECITGMRPFLHGHPSAGFAWVDCVAKKGDSDIYIYWADHPTDPVYSSSLPRPHRLCRPFNTLVTQWLQTALHKEPMSRGVKTTPSEVAPCLSVMEQNLNTLIVSALCMQTGDVFSYIVRPIDTVEDLKANIHDSTTVPTAELYLALPNGHIMENRERVSSCIMEGNVGLVYLFTTALDPSFKMMGDTSPAISTLIVNGDEKIDKHDRKGVYAHTFFHIRQQYHLFERLHKGHKAILTTIHRQRIHVREQEQTLNSAYFSTEALTSHINNLQQRDVEKLRNLVEHNGREVGPASTLASWERLSHQLKQLSESVTVIGGEIGRLKQEVDTYLRLADDLKCASDKNESVFYDFYQQFVIPARKIYSSAKSNHGTSTVGRMADVLVGAKQQAEKIILETLNGYNFGRQYVAMGELLNRISDKKEKILQLKRQVCELSDQQRGDMWNLIDQQMQSRALHQYENWEPTQALTEEVVTHYRHQGCSSESETEQPPRRRSSQWSQLSTDLSDSEMNEKLERSLKKVSRMISVPENEKLEEENKFLLTRLVSVVEQMSLGSTNGDNVAMESGHYGNRHDGTSGYRDGWPSENSSPHNF